MKLNTQIALWYLICFAFMAVLAWGVPAGGPRIKPTGNETCSVSPDPVVQGQDMTILGSGFQPDIHLGVAFTEDPNLMIFMDSDSEGRFAVTRIAAFPPGSFTARIFLNNHAYYWQPDRRNKLLASCDFQVVSQ